MRCYDLCLLLLSNHDLFESVNLLLKFLNLTSCCKVSYLLGLAHYELACMRRFRVNNLRSQKMLHTLIVLHVIGEAHTIIDGLLLS